ncbi:toll/interleukin-1 receptor domain-containing protein [Streptomyces sp. NPDC096132]|uniref:toll/interleukin-1 receptor domain-containing protein n=1 Tax=Streptomyces sp. NPDC096132 TaxID=3366075 RepID=UPI0037F8F4ED
MVMLFISHSSRGDANANAVRQAVQAAAEKSCWSVKVDMDALEPGDEWRSVIYHWVADCDAAVILLSAAAMKSTWVRREVNLLLWRRALGSPVTIIPVLLEDISPPEVRRSELSQLSNLQCLVQRPGKRGGTPRGMAAQVVGRLPRLNAMVRDSAHLSRMRDWTESIMTYLSRVPESPLQSAVRLLTADDVRNFPSAHEGRRCVAHQLLGHPSGERVHDALTRIVGKIERDDLTRLGRLLRPVWINAEAARWLLPSDGPVVMALNTSRPETAEQYIDRAACCSYTHWYRTVSLLAGEGQHEEFMAMCEDAVRSLAHLEEGDPIEDARPYSSEVLYLILDPQDVPLEDVGALVADLGDRFSWLNILVLTGAPSRDATWAAEQGLDWLKVLQPALAATDENEARRAALAMRQLMKRAGA